MKSFFLKFFVLIVFLLFIVFVLIKKLNSFNKNKFETTIANVCTIEEKGQANGIIYKDEKVFSLNQSSVVKNLYKDGTKVGKNTVIAQIYKNKEDSKKHEMLNSLKEELKNLEELKSKDLSENFDFIGLEKQLYSNYNSLLNNIKEREFKKIEETKKAISSILNTKQLIVNKKIDFNSSIEKTKKEIKKIENSIEDPQNIFAKEAGYFVAKIDGLEDKCSIENVDQLNYYEFNDFLNNLNEHKKEDNKKAKILTGSKILFKAFLPTKILVNKKINSECKIKFKENNFSNVAILKKIFLNIKEKNSLAVFEIFDINEILATIRKCEANVVFKEYDGFKIPKSAVKFNNLKNPYVFIINGDFIKAKNVEIIAEDENFYICSYNKNSKEDLNYLKNLDKIIVKGKNLYDNKKI